MKVSKLTVTFFIIILIIFIVVAGKIGFSIGQHDASLSIKEATPKQLAEAMQGDNFWGSYPETMLLIQGKVKSVNKINNSTLVDFVVTSSPSVLPKVTCNFLANPAVKVEDSIEILTVAFDAQRKNNADVLLNNCYLLKDSSG